MMKATFNFCKWYNEVLTEKERKIADEIFDKVIQLEESRKENK